MGAVETDALVADLDHDQRTAVTTPSRLVAVIAGAGSGKTRVLTRRIAHRIADGSADARHTLALTFTREAAGELRRRLHRLGLREGVEAGTFHSVMLGVLRQRWADRDVRPLTIAADQHRLVREAVDAGRGRIDAVLAEIAWAGARGLDPERYATAARHAGRRPPGGVERHARALADYTLLKRRRGVIDFDDVLVHVARDMRLDPDFAAALRWRFRHLLVDEAQDLNPVQQALVDLLRHGRDDLFLVGDPAQAIYGFNGADPTLLVDVEDRFPGVEVVRLPVNHRCTPEIVRAGVHVLEAGRQSAELRSARAEGVAVAAVVGSDEEDEAQQVARRVRATDPAVVRSGQVAVLARTHAQLGPLERALVALGVPTRRPATARGSPLQSAIREGTSNTSAARLRAWAHDTLDDLDAAATPVGGAAPPSAGARRTADAAGATARREDRREDGRDERWEAGRRVATAALEFLREQPLGDGAGFRRWIATTNPFLDTETGVELVTFHAAKGREWHTVFVTGVEKGLVPHRSATTLAQRQEEARLLYVALTRATDRLVLTRARRRAGYARDPSPLVATLDLSEPALPPPPPRARRARGHGTGVGDALRAWRREAALRARVLPHQVCSDRDLATITRRRPATVEELVSTTSLGPLTARRLGPEILDIVARATDPSADPGEGPDAAAGARHPA